MFGLSRSTQYAVMALARLAEAQGGLEQQENAQPEASVAPISARALAEADGSPATLLSCVLKRLHHAGLIASRRGAHGGYYLARPAESMELADVIAAVEGPQPVKLTLCCGEPSEAEQPHETQPCQDSRTPRQYELTGKPRRHTPAPTVTNDASTTCPLAPDCPVTEAMQSLNRRMHNYLRQITLADLIETAPIISSPGVFR